MSSSATSVTSSARCWPPVAGLTVLMLVFFRTPPKKQLETEGEAA